MYVCMGAKIIWYGPADVLHIIQLQNTNTKYPDHRLKVVPVSSGTHCAIGSVGLLRNFQTQNINTCMRYCTRGHVSVRECVSVCARQATY